MTEYKNLLVWQKAIEYVTSVYTLCMSLPQDERYGLTDQLRRAAVSVPSNIAEGSRRSTDKDFKFFLHTALGSLSETETQLLICKNINYISDESYEILARKSTELSKMLMAFIKKLS